MKALTLFVCGHLTIIVAVILIFAGSMWALPYTLVLLIASRTKAGRRFCRQCDNVCKEIESCTHTSTK